MIQSFVSNQEDETQLIELVQGLSNLSKSNLESAEDSYSGIHMENSQVVIQTMASLLEHKNEQVFSAAQRFIGALLSSENEVIVECVMKFNIIERISWILKSSDQKIVLESLWALSNITASSINHIQYFINQENLLTQVLSLTRSYDTSIQIEALWVLVNAVNCGSSNEARKLFQFKNGEVVTSMIEIGFKLQNEKIVKNILEALQKILETDEKFGKIGSDDSVTAKMQQLDALTHIGELAENSKFDVFEQAQDLYNYMQYLLEMIDGDDEHMIDTGANDNMPIDFQI